jgi:predicted AAA+ superfamily ATPase
MPQIDTIQPASLFFGCTTVKICYNGIGFRVNGNRKEQLQGAISMFIERHVDRVIGRALKGFPSILLTGPRQVGKSTLLKEKYGNIPYVLLDNNITLAALKQDPLGFLQLQGTPVILDEIQRAPESFLSIKYMIDSDRHAGMYVLTGSQKYNLMMNVSESLAGRIDIINMLGLSNRELRGEEFYDPFIPTLDYLKSRNSKVFLSLPELWERIHKGSMPELYANDYIEWEEFYASYVSTYIDRDVRQLAQVGDTIAFTQFMTALAARSTELLNMSSLARDVGVDEKTIKRWLSILQTSGIVYLLQPFSLNVNKRMIKTPKVYFTDTGLVCYLCRWLTPETLANGAMAGNVYETFIVDEILKSYYNSGKEPNMYFFRNTDGQEVDLLFYSDGTLYPVEIRKTASPNAKDIKNFKTVQTFFPSLEIGEGGIICNHNMLLPLEGKNHIIPVSMI